MSTIRALSFYIFFLFHCGLSTERDIMTIISKRTYLYKSLQQKNIFFSNGDNMEYFTKFIHQQSEDMNYLININNVNVSNPIEDVDYIDITKNIDFLMNIRIYNYTHFIATFLLPIDSNGKVSRRQNLIQKVTSYSGKHSGMKLMITTVDGSIINSNSVVCLRMLYNDWCKVNYENTPSDTTINNSEGRHTVFNMLVINEFIKLLFILMFIIKYLMKKKY